MKIGLTAAAIAAGLLLTASQASANTVVGALQTHCVSNGSVSACVSTRVITQRIGDRTYAQIFVRNRDDLVALGYRVTGIGLTAPAIQGLQFDNITGITTEGGATESATDPRGDWDNGLNGIGNNIVYFEVATGNNHGGIRGCRPDGGAPHRWFQTCVGGVNDGWVVFSFSTSNDWSADDAGLAYRMQAFYQNGASLTCPNGDYTCTTTTTPPSEVVPEPITMVLLGSGLAGIGGARLRRRRQGLEQDEDAAA